ncbi:indole acetimide hydrolase [Streptomyces armeniacus]|uniref:Indole acetimide hydrolase n=1 Tax=Streptomyces armeniacus TaxID=83291 RepID=A0A345XP17_9ACTN|nr:amidase family protein [Streptomyces armeniacus]AXK33383.1 indole acetimide hydrolase [Streptomyces armeniacus]
MGSEWWKQDAAAVGAAVRAGDVTAAEVIDSHLERIAAVNPAVNAVTQLLADRAREEAAALDRRRATGEELGPLAGVPFTVKETTAIEGLPTTFGAVRFKDHVAPRDAPPVARLRAAGAIPVGHSNMPTLILAGVHPRSELFGDTWNPWDRGISPGGTSGGDGAAVAAGMVPIGLGNDSGGSVRLPAAFCGTAGLKPTTGRFPADHRLGPDDPALCSQVFVVDGPLARTVRDLWLSFEALAGPGADPADPRAVPVPTRLGGPGGRPPRVGVVARAGGRDTHPDVRAAVDAAASALSDSGYAVEEVQDVPRFQEALDAYSSMVMTEFSGSWPVVRTLLGKDGHRYIEMSMDKSAPVELAEYLRLTGVRLNIQRAWAEFQREYPLLLGPVFAQPPVAPGAESASAEGHEFFGRALGLCSVTSFVGVPAVAVPGGVFGGLPQGVQVIGRFFREDQCLDAAAVIEERVGVLTPVEPRG